MAVAISVRTLASAVSAPPPKSTCHGSVYGEHTLAREHANEQPFTRTQSGVEIPNEVDQVTVEERDSKHGYAGTTVTCSCPTGKSAGSWRSSGDDRMSLPLDG
jgi:hypothetical protein